jgi:hypothetical protein
MLKSFTPVMILACSVLAGLEYPSQVTILSIGVISIGTATTCSFVPDMSLVGLLIMFLAEFSEAVRLLMTQFLLQNLKFGVIEGQYVFCYNTMFLPSFFLFMMASLPLSYPSVAACLYSLTPHDTSLTITPSLPQSINHLSTLLALLITSQVRARASHSALVGAGVLCVRRQEDGGEWRLLHHRGQPLGLRCEHVTRAVRQFLIVFGDTSYLQSDHEGA